MKQPTIRFRDRFGEPVHPSRLTYRDRIAHAELFHTVLMRDGLWCQSCQSSGCPHTLRVEKKLVAAGLGTGSQEGFVELPGIERVVRYTAQEELLVECWFDNEARVRWYETSDGDVTRVVFTPEQPNEPAETTQLPDAESASAALVTTLATYCDYRQAGDIAGLRQTHPELALVAGTDD